MINQPDPNVLTYVDPETGQPFDVRRDELEEWKNLVSEEQVQADRVKAGLRNARLVHDHTPRKEVFRDVEKRRYAEQHVQDMRMERLQETVEAKKAKLAETQLKNERAAELAVDAKKNLQSAQEMIFAAQKKLREGRIEAAIAVKIEKQHDAAQERAKHETKREENERAGSVRQEFTGAQRGTPEAISAERLGRWRRDQEADKQGIEAPKPAPKTATAKKTRVKVGSRETKPARQEPKHEYERRQGDAQRSFTDASEDKPTIVNEPSGSQQVANDKPHPAPRPSWAADADRAAHRSDMKYDADIAAGLDRYVAETLAARDASKGSSSGLQGGLGNGFSQSAGQGEGMGMGD